MSFKTISALLRGTWLINKSWTQSHLPLVMQMINGQAPDFGSIKSEEKQEQPLRLSAFSSSAYSVYPGTDLMRLPENSIAVIDVNGPLLKFGDICSYGMVDHANLVARAAKANNIRGIVLNTDSPGGQASGTALFADSIIKARQRKPVVGVVDDGMAASAAMWIISACQEIYVTQPTDQVGSIGVYQTIADWYKHYEEYWKLPVRDIYSPGSEDKNADYREALKGNDELILQSIKVLRDQFVKSISRNRAGKILGEEWKSGDMFYANDAKKMGLIDGIKTYEEVLERTASLAA